MDVQTKVLSYKLVIEKQYILHMSVHHIQYNILNTHTHTFRSPFHLK
jgi:hypothetical protein